MKELISEVISLEVDPSLSISAYRASKTRSADIPTFAKQNYEKSSPAVTLIEQLSPRSIQVDSTGDPCSELGEIRWRHHRARTTDPDLAYAIIQARQRDGDLDTTDVKGCIERFDTVLQAWQDAADVVKSVLDRLEDQEKGSHDEVTQETYIVSTYISFNLLMRRIQRDRGLVVEGSDFRSLQDSTRILDRVLQSCAQLEELPGVHNDETLYNSLQALSGYFRARRVGLIARAYARAGDKKSALALWNAAHLHIGKSTKLTPGDIPEDILSADDFAAAVTEIQSNLERMHGLYALEHMMHQDDGHSSKAAVAESLDVYPIGAPSDVLARLVNFKPSLRAVPVKPVFYDIAFNYIGYLDASVKAEAIAAAASATAPAAARESSPGAEAIDSTTQQKRGGFLRGLWGNK
jgi:signal recognition particle subunit SRP68